MKLIILFCFFFTIGFFVKAQDTSSTFLQNTNSIAPDHLLHLHKVAINPDSIAAFKNKKEFAYSKNLDSLLKELKNSTENNNSSKNKPASFFQRLLNSGVLQFLLWVAVSILIVYILFQLFLSKGFFYKKTTATPEGSVQPDEAVFESQDYNGLYQQAAQKQDFRLATRYLFLKTLQRLNRQSKIKYSAEKTNSNYVSEIQENKRPSFAKLVLHYEYIWYGNKQINQQVFDNIEKLFSSFLLSVSV